MKNAINPTAFDKEAIYDQEIFPLMQRILEICGNHEIPMIASFCYEGMGDGKFNVCSSLLAVPGKTPPTFYRAEVVLGIPKAQEEAESHPKPPYKN